MIITVHTLIIIRVHTLIIRVHTLIIRVHTLIIRVHTLIIIIRVYHNLRYKFQHRGTHALNH